MNTSSLRLAAPAVAPRPRVLFVTGSATPPDYALHRAWALGRALHATMEVVQVLVRTTRVSMLFPQSVASATSAETARVLQSEKALRQVLAEVLPGPTAQVRLEVEPGTYAQTLGAYAEAVQATMIVLAAEERHQSSLVTAIMRASGVPVLVVRPAAGTTVVAATDLGHEGLPVVKTAGALVERLGAALVVVHNIPPMAWLPIGASLVPTYASPDAVASLEAGRRTVLEEALPGLAPDAHAEFRHDYDTVEAILTAARDFFADVLVVGAPMEEHFLESPLAERVLDQARRTVLVTPLN